MSKEDKKISLAGSNEVENISIFIDEGSKCINIVIRNTNTVAQDTYHLDSLKIDDKEPEIKLGEEEDSLYIKNNFGNLVQIKSNGDIEVFRKVDNRLKTLESKVSKSTL